MAQVPPTLSATLSPPVLPTFSPPAASDTTSSPLPSDTSSSSATLPPSSATTSLPPDSSSSSLPPSSESSGTPPPASSSSSSLPPASESSSSPPPTSIDTTSSSTNTPTPSPVVFPSTQADGEVVTVTSTSLVIPSTGGNSITAQNDASSKGFLDNHGAVAGVFTVVGLVGLAILIALITNAVRRRRAKKFDRDVAEAAREAAAAAHASPSNFHDFDDYGYNADQSVYTDNTHGSYGQKPLQPSGYESYNMADLPAIADPTVTAALYRAEQSQPVGEGPWNSAGVGTVGLNRSRSTTAPYSAFAGPLNQHGSPPAMPAADPFHDTAGVFVGGVYPGMPQPQPYSISERNREASGLPAAGTGGVITTARDNPTAHNRSRSGKFLAPAESPPTLSASGREEESYNPYEHSQYVPPATQYQPPSRSQVQQRPVSTTTSVDNPYTAYVSTSSTRDRFSGEDSDKDDDEEEEGEYRYDGRRVLKVANE